MFILGINDKIVEGQWVFDTDGSLVTWKDWVQWVNYPGHPRNGRAGNCAGMLRRHGTQWAGHRSEGWFDMSCESDDYMDGKALSLICQKSRGE